MLLVFYIVHVILLQNHICSINLDIFVNTLCTYLTLNVAVSPSVHQILYQRLTISHFYIKSSVLGLALNLFLLFQLATITLLLRHKSEKCGVVPLQLKPTKIKINFSLLVKYNYTFLQKRLPLCFDFDQHCKSVPWGKVSIEWETWTSHVQEHEAARPPCDDSPTPLRSRALAKHF